MKTYPPNITRTASVYRTLPWWKKTILLFRRKLGKPKPARDTGHRPAWHACEEMEIPQPTEERRLP
jgi:hypothetical protein